MNKVGEGRRFLYFLILFTFFVCLMVYFFVLLPRSLPEWDESGHLLEVLKVGKAMRGFRLKEVFNLVWQQYYYPPLQSLILGVPVALFDFDFVLMRNFSLVFFAISVLMMYFLGKELVEKRGERIGFLAAFLLLTSPINIVFATSALKETGGMLLTLLCLWFYFRKSFWAAGWTLAGLTFWKYNYGGLLAFVFLFEALVSLMNSFSLGGICFSKLAGPVTGAAPKSCGSCRLAAPAPFRRLTRRGGASRLAPPAGGGSIFSVYITRFLVLFGPTVFLLTPWVLGRENGLKNFFRILASGDNIYTLHDTDFWGHLFFYPRAMAFSYCFSWFIAIILTIAFLLSFAKFCDKKWRILTFLFLINFFLATRHMMNNQERYILTTGPAFFLVCSWQSAELIARVRGVTKISPYIRGFVMGALLIMTFLALRDFLVLPRMIKPTGSHTMASPIFNEIDFVDTRYDFNRAHWPRQYAPDYMVKKKEVMEYVMNSLNLSLPTKIVGYINEFSPGLVEIFLMKEREKKGVVSVSGPEQVVILEVADGSRFDTEDYRKMNRWQREVIAGLKKDPNFHVVNHKEFFDLGVTISIYQ